MNVTPSKQPDDRAPFIVPGLRPSADRPSLRHAYIGVAFLVIGFIGIFSGGTDAIGQALLVAGSILVLMGSLLFAVSESEFSATEKINTFENCMARPRSNQSMERTAARRAFMSRVATTFSARPTRALGGRRSSLSR
jgi:hypothetical protein